MKYIGLILLAALAVIVLLLLIAVLRTLLMPSKTSTYVADEPEEEALALASIRCWRNCSLWYMRSWRRQRSMGTCYFTGKEKALRNRSCS